ncbi:MAG TPA: sensor domain-containing diguanylate cyclase [Gemmatimonadaceae bacterium]
MNLWMAQLALPVHAWRPLGLSAIVPLLLAAVILLSRRRGRGIATALTLRTIVVLSIGFGVLATVATVALVHTGLRELRQRHAADVHTLADQVEHGPLGIGAGDALLKLTLFRAKDSDVAFIVAGTDACRSVCLMSYADRRFDPRELKERVAGAWPSSAANHNTISIDDKPYLLVAAPVRGVRGKSHSAVVAGIDAAYLAEQASRTAWLLLAISYSLLAAVGWVTWRQVSHSLAGRIREMHTQLRSGVVDESPHEHLEVDGHELRQLADSVSSYIKRTLDEKSSSEERHRRLAELSPDAVLMCTDRRIRSANPAAIALTGAKTRSDLVASPIDRFLQYDDDKPSDNSGTLRPAKWRRTDGRALHVEVAEITDTIGDEIVRQFVVRDVTNRRLREADLEHRADHDSLTGLVNRARFEKRLRALLDPSAKTSSKFGETRVVAVVFVDLDGFKPVNDTYGHAAGDAVLVAVAARLRESTRGSDLIARLGGDEFAVLLEVRDALELGPVAERILRALHTPIPYDVIGLSVGASIGVASTRLAEGTNEPALSAAELVNAADDAMYTAKALGGHQFVIASLGERSPDARPEVSFPATV